MRQRTFYLLLILLSAVACGRQQDRLRNGDLIFVGLPAEYGADSDSMDAAISSATGPVRYFS